MNSEKFRAFVKRKADENLKAIKKLTRVENYVCQIWKAFGKLTSGKTVSLPETIVDSLIHDIILKKCRRFAKDLAW